MKTTLAAGALLLILALMGCIQNNSNTGNPLEGIDEGVVPGIGKLVAGAACEVDEDCVYALNAYPAQECISPNCPPEDQPQPEWGDPNYEWKQTYLDECVNAAQLDGKNLQGEELLIDTRAATCTCQTIDLANTSLDGQKICRKKIVEEAPVENTGV